MASRSLILFAAVFTLTAASLTSAGESKTPAVTFHPHAQERARFEILPDRATMFGGDVVGGWRIGNRARLGLEARFGKVASVMVQLQDVRTWGSEVNAANGGEGTLFDYAADGLDLHQAYGQLRFGDVRLRVGRQEIAWHGQRLIGSVLWSHQGRSFDAVRVVADHDKVGYDLFYAPLLDRPVLGDTTFTPGQDAHLVAFRAGPRAGDAFALDGLFVGRIDLGIEAFLGTFGVHAKGKVSAFSWEAEAYGQVSKNPAETYGAYMFGVRAGGDLGERHYLGGGIDLLSGTNDSGSVRAFDTLFATNHKFYGHFDAYLALPAHTSGQGLLDGMINTRFGLHETVKLSFDAHVFASAVSPEGSSAFHGVELDTNLEYKPWKVLTLMTGVWVYVPGGFWGEAVKPELGAYLSTDFQFK